MDKQLDVDNDDILEFIFYWRICIASVLYKLPTGHYSPKLSLSMVWYVGPLSVIEHAK